MFELPFTSFTNTYLFFSKSVAFLDGKLQPIVAVKLFREKRSENLELEPGTLEHKAVTLVITPQRSPIRSALFIVFMWAYIIYF